MSKNHKLHQAQEPDTAITETTQIMCRHWKMLEQGLVAF